MIDVIKPGDEAQKNVQNEKDSVLTNLKDEKNVTFEWDKIKLPETEFTNIQEALAYIEKQENILLHKNRENNTEAIKEINDILDMYLAKGIIKKEDYMYKYYWKIKDFLLMYKWNLSDFMPRVVKGRKKEIVGDSEEEDGMRDKHTSGANLLFKRSWLRSKEDREVFFVNFIKTEWEDLIKFFKKNCEMGLNESEMDTTWISRIQLIYEEYKSESGILD